MADEHPLDKYHSLKPPTVEQAKADLLSTLNAVLQHALAHGPTAVVVIPDDYIDEINALIAAVRAENDVAKAYLASAIDAHAKREDWWQRMWDGVSERADAAETEVERLTTEIAAVRAECYNRDSEGDPPPQPLGDNDLKR